MGFVWQLSVSPGHLFVCSAFCSLNIDMQRAPVTDGGRQRRGRYRPYSTNASTRTTGGGRRSLSLQDDQYGPNEGLFDRESVVDMVSTATSSTNAVYDSDYENSGPEETSTSFSRPFLSVPNTSTPLRERNQHSFTRERTEKQHGLQSPDIIAMLQEQQQLLQTLIHTQESMKQCQTVFDKKLTALQQQVATVSSSCSPSSSEEKKCKVTRELTVSCFLWKVCKIIIFVIYP